jgi:hypothetical protein
MLKINMLASSKQPPSTLKTSAGQLGSMANL